MRFFSFAILTLNLGLSHSSALPRRPICGSDNPSPEALAAIQLLAASEQQSGANTTLSLSSRQTTISVNAYFHAVTNTSVPLSYPSDSLLVSQLAAMNSAYAGAGVHFVFAGSDRIQDDALATGAGIFDGTPSDALVAYLQDNRLGTYADLNLFFYTNVPDPVLGQCSFPVAATPLAENFWQDSCHIATGTLPGQDFEDYNYGGTAIHEGKKGFSD